jgi:hypothetical protein
MYAGEPLKITIDDRLPGFLMGKRQFFVPGFAGTDRAKSGQSWWGPLLEKAFAKYYRNYLAMLGGTLTQSLWPIAGMPIETAEARFYSPEEYYGIVSEWDKKDYVMLGIASGKYRDLGIVSPHAYTVIGVAEYNGTKLVKMRNPWGLDVYKGSWGDMDTVNMTEEARIALNHPNNTEDGVFFVDYTDFYKFFPTVSVALWQDWKIESKHVELPRTENFKGKSFQFENPVTQDLAVVIGNP